jgi:hypothetical protein
MHGREYRTRCEICAGHLRTAGEFIRILMTLNRMGQTHTAAFLASAPGVHGLARRWPHQGPFLVLAPTDKALPDLIERPAMEWAQRKRGK